MNQVRKILILSANPKDTARLRLDEEVREIEEGLRRSRHRDQFTIQSKWAVRLRDLRRAMLDEEPQIVHFCGHGEEDGLMVEDDNGNAILVNPGALTGLFELFKDKVECVLLNACYSEPQADAIIKHIEYIIGMSRGITDKAALEFAVGFYDALGAGKSIEEAFKFGRNAIQLYNIPEHLTPILKKRAHSQTEQEQKIQQQEEKPLDAAIREQVVVNKETRLLTLPLGVSTIGKTKAPDNQIEKNLKQEKHPNAEPQHAEKRINTYDVFISHSSRRDPDDHELIDKLAQGLRHRGLKVFLDRMSLEGGKKLLPSLENALEHTRVGLIVLTQNALESGWVEVELEIIRRRSYTGSIHLLVLRLDPKCQVPQWIKAENIIDPPSRYDLYDITERVENAIRSISPY